MANSGTSGLEVNCSFGVGGQSCKNFALNQSGNIAELLEALRTKAYRPSPVKRVEIEKPDGGIRLIGIPTVRDRVVQQALKMAIDPIFEAGFHSGSYGYRPPEAHMERLPRQPHECARRGWSMWWIWI